MFGPPVPAAAARSLPRASETAIRYGPALAVASIFFLLALDGGTFGLSSRNTAAIAIWWALLLGVLARVLPLATPPRAGLTACGALAGMAVLSLLSAAWGASAERAFVEFDRVALYVGAFVLTLFLTTRGSLGRWLDGLSLMIVAVGLLALTSRLLPDLVSPGDALALLPASQNRVSFPLGYWNGLAILLALGFPLLLRTAMVARLAPVRSLAIGVLPALAGVIYLTSSRGGVVTALIGACAFVGLASRRLHALAWLGLVGIASGAVVAVLRSRPDLVNLPGTPLAEAQGRSAAAALGALAALTALAHLVAERGLVCSRAGSARAERLVLGGLVVLLVGGVLAANPVQRFRDFKHAPADLAAPQVGSPANATEEHLGGLSGTGRWQQWEAAVDAFQAEPLLGIGAGSYEAWWAQHGSLVGFVSDGHSLYLETLGELGIFGFALIAAFFALGAGYALTRTLRVAGEERTGRAALCAALIGFAFAAGIDWMWEMTVVGLVGVTLVALSTGHAAAGEDEETATGLAWSRRRRFAAVSGVAAVTAFVIYAEAVPLIASLKLEESQEAVFDGDPRRALGAALDARALEPWASSPYLQLAQVAEDQGDLSAAQRWIGEAIERDPSDWRLRLVAAGIATRSGDVAKGAASLKKARELNPRSPLFRSAQESR